jgi:hypothetical protein
LRSRFDSRPIELSQKSAHACVREKSILSPSVTFFCSNALSILIISLKQFL